jgi:hypothetical protein
MTVSNSFVRPEKKKQQKVIFAAFVGRFWGNAPGIPEHPPSPPNGPSFEDWQMLLASLNQKRKGLSEIPTVSQPNPNTMCKSTTNRHQGGTITPRSPTEDEKPWSEEDIESLMASLERLRDAQEAGQNIAKTERWIWPWELYELNDLMNVVCTGEPDEATLKTLPEEHRATAHFRKRKRPQGVEGGGRAVVVFVAPQEESEVHVGGGGGGVCQGISR